MAMGRSVRRADLTDLTDRTLADMRERILIIPDLSPNYGYPTSYVRVGIRVLYDSLLFPFLVSCLCGHLTPASQTQLRDWC